MPTYAVADLRHDTRLQSRESVDHDAIAEYAEIYRTNPASMPAVRVVLVAGTPMIVDGFHRASAAKAAGVVELEVEVVAIGTIENAIEEAARANQGHGIRRTRADKRRAVAMLLQLPHWQRHSARMLAMHVGVSPSFVADLIKQNQEVTRQVSIMDTSNEPARVTGNDGKSYPKRERPAKRPEPPSPASPLPESPKAEEPLQEPPKAAEVDEYVRHIGLLRSRLKRALRGLHVDQVDASLKRAEQLLALVAPVECPTCVGKPAGCRSCGARGWMTRGDAASLLRGAR